MTLQCNMPHETECCQLWNIRNKGISCIQLQLSD